METHERPSRLLPNIGRVVADALGIEGDVYEPIGCVSRFHSTHDRSFRAFAFAATGWMFVCDQAYDWDAETVEDFATAGVVQRYRLSEYTGVEWTTFRDVGHVALVGKHFQPVVTVDSSQAEPFARRLGHVGGLPVKRRRLGFDVTRDRIWEDAPYTTLAPVKELPGSRGRWLISTVEMDTYDVILDVGTVRRSIGGADKTDRLLDGRYVGDLELITTPTVGQRWFFVAGMRARKTEPVERILRTRTTRVIHSWRTERSESRVPEGSRDRWLIRGDDNRTFILDLRRDPVQITKAFDSRTPHYVEDEPVAIDPEIVEWPAVGGQFVAHVDLSDGRRVQESQSPFDHLERWWCSVESIKRYNIEDLAPGVSLPDPKP